MASTPSQQHHGGERRESFLRQRSHDSVANSVVDLENNDSEHHLRQHSAVFSPRQSLHEQHHAQSPSSSSGSPFSEQIKRKNSDEYFNDNDEDDSNSKDGSSKESSQSSSLSAAARHWTRFTQWLHFGISEFVLFLSMKAAHNPRTTIGLIMLISFAMIGTGLATNFVMELSEAQFAPMNVDTREHLQFTSNVSKYEANVVGDGFPPPARGLNIQIHANGANVMTYGALKRMFDAIDVVRGLENYHYACSGGMTREASADAPTCFMNGPGRWWGHNTTRFEEETQGSDEIVRAFLSNDTFPDGTPAFHHFFMGSLERDPETNIIEFAKSIAMVIELPAGNEDEMEIALEFELDFINAMKPLREEWADEPYRLEFLAIRSLTDELMRAINNDIFLVPCVFLIMTLFTCSIFYRNDKVQSRTMLGLGSVVTIAMSIMTGYGLAFIAGVPFTSMTQILPFVIFGVGLDDTFIITGAYFRTDPKKDTMERVRETMEEIGNSISLTTITTTVAFCLGCITTIPCIRWLCLYAFPTIFIDFVYQITFFIAVLVLDEERIKANRRDFCCCVVVPRNGAEDSDSEEDARTVRTRLKTEDEDSDDASAMKHMQASLSTPNGNKKKVKNHEKKPHKPIADRFMAWYADQLLRPAVKAFVIVAFTAFLGGCIYSATQLKQAFKPADFMPDDSYAVIYLDVSAEFELGKLRFPTYFRFVDQSNEDVQDQMRRFIDDTVNIPAFGIPPEYCWVKDFERIKNGEVEEFDEYRWIFNGTLTFYEQLDLLLDVPEIGGLYGGDFARNEDGEIVSSRCWLTVDTLDLDNVQEQVDLLKNVSDVMRYADANQGHDDYPFFITDPIFYIWEFYSMVVSELIFTTVSGVVAITVLGLILIPHWSAALFVTPLLCVLYIDLLGTIQFAGLYINPLTYVCLVISIGLLVDFLMHIMLRYFESTCATRDEKVKDTLRTMGASILVGGLSTCLGVIPLAFSTSGILKTVFISFISMVSLGVGHGLILLPVLLSYFGPEVCVRMHHDDLAQKLHMSPRHGADKDCDDEDRPGSATEELEFTEVAAAAGAADVSMFPSFDTADGSMDTPPDLQLLEGSIDVDDFLGGKCGDPAASAILSFVEEVNSAAVPTQSSNNTSTLDAGLYSRTQQESAEEANHANEFYPDILQTTSSGSIDV